MLNIATRNIEPAGPVTVVLAGALRKECLAELESALDTVRRAHLPIVIDLGEVTLVDRLSVQFLIAQIERDVQLVNCPE